MPAFPLPVQGDESPRLTRLLQATWDAVPRSARRRLRRYWRSRHAGTVRLELVGYWSGYRAGVAGNTSNVGALMRFHTPSVTRMSDNDCRYVIAHELAHVLQFAEGQRLAHRSAQAERDARARALTWLGFSRCPRSTAALHAYHMEQWAAERRTKGGA